MKTRKRPGADVRRDARTLLRDWLLGNLHQDLLPWLRKSLIAADWSPASSCGTPPACAHDHPPLRMARAITASMTGSATSAEIAH